MADSDEISAWQYFHRKARWWQGLCFGIFVAWSLTAYSAPARSVVDQIGNNPIMLWIVWAVLMAVGGIPGAILETIDHIRRFRQKNKAAAAWCDRTSQ